MNISIKINLENSNAYEEHRKDKNRILGKRSSKALEATSQEFKRRSEETDEKPKLTKHKFSHSSDFQKCKLINKSLTQARDCREIISIIENNVHSFNAVNASTAIHRLAKKSGRRTNIEKLTLESLTAIILDKIPECKPQQLANIAWAFATLGYENKALFESLGAEAVRKIRDFNPQDIANTAWAFATLGYENKALFESLGVEAVRKIRDFNPQNIANTAWAFATLGYENKALFESLGAEAVRKIRDFKPQELANIAWAFATLGYENKALFESLGDEAVRKIRDFNPQNIANTAWAFATLGYENKALFESLGVEAVRKIRDFNPQELANIAWAFATLGYENKALFESLGAETVRKIRDFNPQDIANTAWAFATLGYENKALFESLGDEAVRKIRDFKPQGLANTAWAFAVMNTLDLPFVNQIGKQMECFKQNFASPFNEKETHQLLSVWVYASLHFPEDHISWPEWLLNEMAKYSEARKKQAPQSSHLHDQVSIVLNKMNKVFLKEYYFRSYFLDLAFPEDKLCIEVNGPAHYIPGTNRYFGAEILRRTILIKSGWKIATVHYKDWDKLKSEAGQKEYLSLIIARASLSKKSTSTISNKVKKDC